MKRKRSAIKDPNVEKEVEWRLQRMHQMLMEMKRILFIECELEEIEKSCGMEIPIEIGDGVTIRRVK